MTPKSTAPADERSVCNSCSGVVVFQARGSEQSLGGMVDQLHSADGQYLISFLIC